MSFGQSSGPPATARQVQELLELLQAAGHTDFRDARGPMSFTQRQAAGKFTRDEAEALIAQLQDAEHAAAGGAAGAPDQGAGGGGVAGPSRSPRSARPSEGDDTLRHVTSEQLAGELQRRGWVVLEP